MKEIQGRLLGWGRAGRLTPLVSDREVQGCTRRLCLGAGQPTE